MSCDRSIDSRLFLSSFRFSLFARPIFCLCLLMRVGTFGFPPCYYSLVVFCYLYRPRSLGDWACYRDTNNLYVTPSRLFNLGDLRELSLKPGALSAIGRVFLLPSKLLIFLFEGIHGVTCRQGLSVGNSGYWVDFIFLFRCRPCPPFSWNLLNASAVDNVCTPCTRGKPSPPFKIWPN